MHHATVATRSTPWKHGPYCHDQFAVSGTCHFILTIRHPLSYLVSYYDMLRSRSPHIDLGSFAQWVRDSAKGRPHALRMWSFAYGYWIWRINSGMHGDFAVVRLEDMLARPAEEMQRLAHIYGVPIAAEIQLPNTYVAPGFGKPRLGQTFETVRNRVVEDETWRDSYSLRLADYAWSHLDRHVAARYGYYQEMTQGETNGVHTT